MKTILLLLVAVNLVSFTLYGLDKLKAKKGLWRIRESTLLLIAALGGSVGALLGMEVFRHKTKHWQFKVLVPVFLVLHIALAVWLVKSGLLP
jgi:Predicted membrane protein